MLKGYGVPELSPTESLERGLAKRFNFPPAGAIEVEKFINRKIP